MHSRKREFITLIGSTVAWPLAARAQPAKLPTVGLGSAFEACEQLANVVRHIAVQSTDQCSAWG